MNVDEDADTEQQHHEHTIRAFTAYRYHSLASNNLRRQSYMSLQPHQQKLLPNQLQLINEIDYCITNNAEFLEDIAAAATAQALLQGGNSVLSKTIRPKPKVTEHEMEKLRSTLRQIHRDWSEEGKSERDASYEPILHALDAHYSHVSAANRRNIRVLVPGCGLGRLAYEIARKGYSAQGNEFSTFMLFSSNFILNATTAPHEFSIHPFCHSLSNTRVANDATRAITIPDVLPRDVPEGTDFSMAAGDFCEIYRDEVGQWDCVATCFFIDTAHNIVEYLEVIASILKKGGLWINLGPSLWHFEGTIGLSLDLPMDEVKALARRVPQGLQIEVSMVFITQ
ncbi:MAG: hypothetical protein CYPHOPRED_001558 [Cyphobasidiales sp. Tagirdzhanova-0007]|nr:MAG: hypothetical protein CYPHOPRED_001558 [Cyphobasidiales sp. Tagirdzhanova-0007]